MTLIKRFPIAWLFFVLCSLACISTAYAQLDGRTDFTGGIREPSQQDVRIVLNGQGHCLRVAVAGVQTRNADPSPPTASGTIVLPPGPAAGNVVWAGLYWVILGNTPPAYSVTLNGAAVSATPLPVTGSPCWPERSAYPYFADVTSLVVAGANSVAGLDDSGTLPVAPESEGATLVVVYESDTEGACEIIVTDGNDLMNQVGQIYDNPLPVTCGNGIAANLWFIGGDGQTGIHGYAPDDQLWDGVLLSGSHDDWNASDPDAPGTEPDLGWDSDHWAVTTSATNTASIDMPYLGGPGDCVNWVATVIEVGVQQCVLPSGACCFPDGHCEFVTEEVCNSLGGIPQGPGILCDPNPCPPPNEACCFPDGHCEILTADACRAQGGVPQGYGSVCDPNTCPQPPRGACCIGNQGDCQILTQAECEAQGGNYQGDGSTCEPTNPCTVVPTQNTTWGKIKATYR